MKIPFPIWTMLGRVLQLPRGSEPNAQCDIMRVIKRHSTVIRDANTRAQYSTSSSKGVSPSEHRLCVNCAPDGRVPQCGEALSSIAIFTETDDPCRVASRIAAQLTTLQRNTTLPCSEPLLPPGQPSLSDNRNKIRITRRLSCSIFLRPRPSSVYTSLFWVRLLPRACIHLPAEVACIPVAFMDRAVSTKIPLLRPIEISNY